MTDWLSAKLNSLRSAYRTRKKRTPPQIVDRDARTLQHWRHQFAGSERTIECHSMRLIGRDGEGDIFAGPGRIVIDDNGIRFFMYGTADNNPAAFRKYLSAQASPYDPLEQFRLVATDYRGATWMGGYTSVDFFTDHDRDWPLTGELQGLSTHVSDFWVARSAGFEMLLIPAVDLPMDEAMETSTLISGELVYRSRAPAGSEWKRSVPGSISSLTLRTRPCGSRRRSARTCSPSSRSAGSPNRCESCSARRSIRG